MSLVVPFNEAVLELIRCQRILGWPDFGPEKYCHRCGGVNVRSWYVDSDRFNAAVGSGIDDKWNGIICPGCFVELHEASVGMVTSWKLIPDPMCSFRWPEPDEDLYA